MAVLKMAVQAMDQSSYKILFSSPAAKQTPAGSLLPFDDSQLNSVAEDPLLQLGYEPLEVQQYMPPLGTPEQQNRVPIEALPPPKKDTGLGFRSGISLFDNVMAMIARAVSRQTVEISKHQQRTNSRMKDSMYSPMREGQAARGKRFIDASLKCLLAVATSKLFPFHTYNNIITIRTAKSDLI